MSPAPVDVLIVGAGPVGLASAFLAHKLGLTVSIIDRSNGPLTVGRADAMNARTLQLLHLLGDDIFEELHPKGLHCCTSSVWKNGGFTSRQNSWWKALKGCEHKHFLMLGQSYLEEILDRKLQESGCPVQRTTTVLEVGLDFDDSNISSTWARIRSQDGTERTLRARFLIGADGVHSFVRKSFPQEVTFDDIGSHAEMTWAVLDGFVETTFPRDQPEIINFQVDTNDVAKIPREGECFDRYYVRMDTGKAFTTEEAVAKIVRAVQPHPFRFSKLQWSSQFTVRERLASSFSVHNRVFFAGDACHVHSVNGGQGLNTGLADAFNLIWKLNLVSRGVASQSLLQTYEAERRPVAKSVIETAGALVRATKYATNNTQQAREVEETNSLPWDHAKEYVRLVQLNSRFITGMGISYFTPPNPPAPTPYISSEMQVPLIGYRGFDFYVAPAHNLGTPRRLYHELRYDGKFNVLLFLPFPISSWRSGMSVVRSMTEAIPGALLPFANVRLVFSPLRASEPDTPSDDIECGLSSVAQKPLLFYKDVVVPESEIGDTSGYQLYSAALGLSIPPTSKEEGPWIVVVLRPDSYVGYAAMGKFADDSFGGMRAYMEEIII